MPRRPPSSRALWTSLPGAESPEAAGLASALVLAVRAYQVLVAPVLPPSCRFTPSCSAFTIEALRRHGASRGLRLALLRVARCHPWHPGGYDPVPARRL